MEPPPITGSANELINRLQEVLDNLDQGDEIDVVGVLLAVHLHLDLPHDSKQRQRAIPELAAAALRELNAAGFASESLLVRGVLACVDASLAHQSGTFEVVNRNRAAVRARLSYFLEHLDEYRSWLAESPGSEDIQTADEDLRARLRQSLEAPQFQDVDADTASRAWTARAKWQRLINTWLPEEVFERWESQAFMPHFDV